MINSSQYEKLIKEGYIESGSLVIRVDDITKIELSPEQVKSISSKQGARQDKAVVFVDAQGRVKKLSSLMFGYNKGQVQLADGSFANSDDLLAAMETAIGSLEEGTIVVDKKGNPIDTQDLLRVVEEAAGKVKIGERSSKVTNQDSREWSVEGAHSDVVHKKGVVFLGNGGIDLKSGDYVSVDELLVALNEYVVMKPGKKEEPKIPGEEPGKEPEKIPGTTVTVRRKYKNKLSRWLALLAALLILLSGIRVKDNVTTVEVPVEVQEQIMMLIQQDQLDYELSGITHELTYETLEEAQKRIVSGYTLGESVQLEDGDTLYENSVLGGQKAVIGNGLRQAGAYQISGVSIVYNGTVYDFHVDLDVSDPGLDIGNFVNETCEKNNLDLSQIEIRLHIGSTADNTRTGWIDITELINEDSVERQVTSDTPVVSSTYNGTQENFDGSTITIETVNGNVDLKVVDENGNLLQPGTIVVGSDGQEYKIGDLELSTVEVEQTQEATTTVMEEQQVVDGKKLTWRIQDCSLAVGIAPLVGAIAAAVANKKKNEESQKLPNLFEFENEPDYQRFKREFEESKAKYEKSSGFGQMLRRIFYREEYDILQKLTPEQVQEVYKAIRGLNNEAYRYSAGDQIQFRNGKIIIITKDQMMQDITDLVIPLIGEIGKDNPVEAEGLLDREEGQNNGIHL